MSAWGDGLPDNYRLDQFKLVYDYVKFHLGLYLGTPTVFALVARSLSVDNEPWFRCGLFAMILVFLISGIHASLFMSRHVNTPWDTQFSRDSRPRHFPGSEG